MSSTCPPRAALPTRPALAASCGSCGGSAQLLGVGNAGSSHNSSGRLGGGDPLLAETAPRGPSWPGCCSLGTPQQCCLLFTEPTRLRFCLGSRQCPGCLERARSLSKTFRRADKVLRDVAVPSICLICCCHTFFREQTRRATRARHSPPESWLLFSGYKPKLTSVSPPAKFALTGILMSVGQTVKSIHLSKSKPTAFSLSQAGTKPVPVCSQRPSRALGRRALPPPAPWGSSATAPAPPALPGGEL